MSKYKHRVGPPPHAFYGPTCACDYSAPWDTMNWHACPRCKAGGPRKFDAGPPYCPGCGGTLVRLAGCGELRWQHRHGFDDECRSSGALFTDHGVSKTKPPERPAQDPRHAKRYVDAKGKTVRKETVSAEVMAAYVEKHGALDDDECTVGPGCYCQAPYLVAARAKLVRE